MDNKNHESVNIEINSGPREKNKIQITENNGSITKASQDEKNEPTSINLMTASLSKTDGGLVSEYT